jgi:hypothetical protein
MDMTLQQKLALQQLVQTGKQVSKVAYNPTTVTGNPEQAALAAGWVQYYRQDTPNLVEVIYTK